MFDSVPCRNSLVQLTQHRITIVKMHPQTRRQREVLDFIRRYLESHGYRPSYQVIARHMGVTSRAGIARIVGDLESQGFLERKRLDGHFAITLTEHSASPADSQLIRWLEVPGSADGSGYDDFQLPEFILGGHDAADFRAFKVPDDALSDIAICRGDIALIELRPFSRDGDVVAAVVETRGAILRKFYRVGSSIELSSENHNTGNIRLPADRVEILGIYKGLIRPLT